MTVAGLLLAAGAGRRAGGPKALRRNGSDRTWVEDAAALLLDAGCDPVLVVLGAAADDARAALRAADRPDVAALSAVVARDWDEGMGASLRAGLSALVARDEDGAETGAESALVMLVDLPDVTAAVLRRLAGAAAGGQNALARAAYHGVPGHPVLLGRAHWPGVIDSAGGDRGARDYLAARDVLLVECGDLATGADRDHP